MIDLRDLMDASGNFDFLTLFERYISIQHYLAIDAISLLLPCPVSTLHSFCFNYASVFSNCTAVVKTPPQVLSRSREGI